jgi:hypothetical protein
MYKRKTTRLYGRKKMPQYALGGVVNLDKIREDYPPEVKTFLDKHGDEKITSIKVGRTPVSGVVSGILNVVSLGALKQATKKAGIDTLYHLYLIINDKYRFEKNQLITFGNYKPQGKDEQVVPINFSKDDLTIGEFVDKGVKYMGKNDYFTYGAFGNRNCQGFVMGNLRGNGITPPTAFIQQDVETIVKNTPSYLPKITNALTDVAGVLDLIKQKVRKLLPFEEGGQIDDMALTDD